LHQFRLDAALLHQVGAQQQPAQQSQLLGLDQLSAEPLQKGFLLVRGTIKQRAGPSRFGQIVDQQIGVDPALKKRLFQQCLAFGKMRSQPLYQTIQQFNRKAGQVLFRP